MACCGDIPTLETLAAVDLLREHLPELKVRVVNVVDLMRLQPDERASARALRPRVRRALHHRSRRRLRLPRLPVADPPPHLPAHEPRQPPRPRLQGRGHDDDAVRHGHAQRPRPLPPRDRRDRPRPGPRRRAPPHLRQEMQSTRRAARPRLHARARRRRPRDPRLDLAATEASSSSTPGSTSLKLSLVDENGSEPVASLDRRTARTSAAVGHRVVHGGDAFDSRCRSTQSVLAELGALARARTAPQRARR